MKTDEAIEMLRAMQNKVVDYAEMVGAPDFAYGCKYVYPEPEDYAIEEAIKALEEIQQYRVIGTVEECREAMEKQIPKKPRDVEYDYSYFVCDNCGTIIYTSDEFESHHYCLNCGQAIEWPDMNLEGMKDEKIKSW